MGLLAWTRTFALTLSLAACYAPETRDCTIKCTMQDDCAGEQTCSGGFCVSSADVQCMTSTPGSATVDAGVVGTGAIVDAAVDAPPDAPTEGQITLDIAGKGRVELDDIGTCDSGEPQKGHCQFTVPLSDTVTMRAIADHDWRFERWTTTACPVDTWSTCVFAPTLTMQLGVKFRKDD